ncbi:MAG: OsmC family protein [Elusimicrobia bacterium]|nr:OsmC family protein [Elusimicrobiota bacterium]
MTRKGSARWHGGLKDGRGSVSVESGALKGTAYGFNSRFAGEKGTNPEELIAAAHAACFTMALSGQLGELGVTAEDLETTAVVTMEKLEPGWTVTKVHLAVTAKIPGSDEAKLQTAAAKAKEGCPVSRLLNAVVTMEATLDPQPAPARAR